MAQEIWKDIDGFNGIYQVSNLGRIKRVDRDLIKVQQLTKFGYLVVGLTKNGKEKNYFVHRLIAKAFIPNPNNYPVVNHLNGIKTDNSIKNLEWTTHAENNRHAVRNKLNDCGVRVALYINGKEIARFDSLAEAGRFCGVGRTTIYERIHRCKHQKRKTKNVEWVELSPPPNRKKNRASK